MSLTHLHHADFDKRFTKKLTMRWPPRLMVICKRGPADAQRSSTSCVLCRMKMKLSWRSRPLNSSPCSTQNSRKWFWTKASVDGTYLGGTIFNKFSFGHRVCLELACKTNRFEVFHLFRAETFCKSMVRPGRQSCVGCLFKNIEALCVHVSCWWTIIRVVRSTPRLSSIRAGDQSLMRVLLQFGETIESRHSCSWEMWSVVCT